MGRLSGLLCRRCAESGGLVLGSGYWLDLGLLPYVAAFAIQERLFEALAAG